MRRVAADVRTDLDALEKLRAAADPSQWRAEVQYKGQHAVVNPEGDAVLGNWMVAKCYWPEIAQMIAAEHNAMPALSAELRELRELVGCATEFRFANCRVRRDDGYTKPWRLDRGSFVLPDLRFDTAAEALAAAKKWEAENAR